MPLPFIIGGTILAVEGVIKTGRYLDQLDASGNEQRCKDYPDMPECFGAYKSKYDIPDGDELPEDSISDEEADDLIDVLAANEEELTDEEAMAMLGMPTSDPASGGPPQTDPAQEATAANQTAAAEPEPPNEEMVVTANRTQPTLRGFTDQTFTLMHLVNLINARNEPLDPEISKMAENDPFTESTLKKLKSPLPAAYNAVSDSFAANASIQCYGDPYSFLNYLTAWPGYRDYLNSSTEKLSAAATQIRIFKVFQEEKREEAVEIVFPTAGIGAAELEELLKSGAKRGYGAGIKDLTITIDGTNPITRTRMISASLVIYADSMETLLKPRKGRIPADLGWTASGPDTSELNYRYADLAMRSDTVPGTNGGKDIDGAFGMLDDLDYKLVFEVGLTSDPAANALMAGYTSVSMSLQPVIHSYQIEQDGSITLSIDYKGFIEKEFSNPAIYDVFANSNSVAKDLAKQLGSYYLKQTCGSKAAKSFNENVVAEGNAQLKERVASLMTKLRLSGLLYYVKIDEDVIHAYNTAFNSYEKVVESSKTGAPKNGKEKETLSPGDKKRIEEAFKKLQEALRKIVDQADDTESLSLSMVSSNSVENQAKEVEKAAEDAGEEEDAGNVRTCAIDPNNTQVAFFYAGDLINLILRNLTDVYSADTTSLCCGEAMRILEADPIFTAVLGQQQGAMGAKGGNADNLFWQIESNPWNLEGDLKQTQIDDRVEQLIEASSEIQNKYADTKIGMEQIKRNFAARFTRFEKLRVVLGPTIFKDFFTNNEIMCSIGDIPIALNHFSSWLASEVEGKDKHRFGLVDFLDKFINQYLRGYLMGDMKTHLGIIGDKKSYTSAALVAYNPMSLTGKNIDVLTAHRGTNRRGLKYEEIAQDARPILDTSGNRQRASSIRDSYDYLVFHEKHTKPVFNMMPKDPRVNKASYLSYFGISMFQHGRDRGILKTAEYQTTNIQGLKEARAQSGKFNGLAQLAEVFDVTLNCYADLQMYPGNRLYLDPKSLVPFLSKKTLDSLNGYNLGDFGIGGFYVVNSVQHSFAQGKFETTIKAQWEQWQKEKPKKKNQSEQKYNEFTQKLNEPIKEACKTGSDPDMGDLGELYESAEEIARSIFGDSVTDTVIGYIKGLSDIATSFFDSDGDGRNETASVTEFGSAAEFAADQTTSNMFPKESNPNRPPPGQVVHNGPNLPAGADFKDFSRGEHKGESMSDYVARKEVAV
jgi:hypothetical protein